jgi:hypothetical protein
MGIPIRLEVTSAIPIQLVSCGVHKLGPGVDLRDLQADRVYELHEIM